MGSYLNPKNRGFAESLSSEIYVDKSGLIEFANSVIGTKQKNICISRPRRFGKSMAAEMLAAYYSRGCDSKQMFQGLKIAESESFEKHLNQYNVIFVSIQDFFNRTESIEFMLSDLQNTLFGELRDVYGDFIQLQNGYLDRIFLKIYQKTGDTFVFIIDEWDCVFREKKMNAEGYKVYLDFLRNLFKDKPYVELAYMTGILPIKKYGSHSALNMFDEYSMTDSGGLAQYAGFTDYEVKDLCKKYAIDFEEIQYWYDGYYLDDAHIYNPKSVVDALRRKKCKSYWTRTETYEALKVYIMMNFDGLRDAVVRMIGGGYAAVDTLSFQNDMSTFRSKDDVLTLLVHLGYLAYDERRQEVFIPNHEVEMEFVTAVKAAGWNEVIQAVSSSQNLLAATLNLDSGTVAEEIAKTHRDNVS